MADPLDFAAAVKRAAPPWLRRVVGGAVLGAIGDVMNEIRDATARGVAARFPGAIDLPSALSYIGRDRVIIRGLGEPSSSYAGRLRRWWDDHRFRGGPYPLLEQLRAFYASSPRRIDLVYESGTRLVLHPDGSITRDAIAWRDTAGPAWALLWVFVHLPAGVTEVGTVEAAGVLSIVRSWTAGHVSEYRVFGLYDGADLWGYPEGELWGADDAFTWGDPVAIDFTSIPLPEELTIDGEPLLLDGEPLVI